MKNNLINRLASGNGMLFTGAGFSMGAINVLGVSPPRGRELVDLLKSDGGMEELEVVELDVVVEVYLEENSPERLIKILRDNYTIRDVSEEHKTVAMVPWRRCYTTNYDEVFEKASHYSSNVYKPITLGQSIEESYEDGKVCIHVNGFIGNLNKNTINSEFKLSESSYSSGGFFNENQWYYYFNRDLEQSACIVLIGYSLYDYEFRKLFHDDAGNIKDKIFIITSENASEREVKFFEKYGNVLKIGLEGFSTLIKENFDKLNTEKNRNNLSFFKKHNVEEYEKDIILNDVELENFLVFGNLSDDKIIADLNSSYNQLVIRKEKIKQVIDDLKCGNNVLLNSSLGNGKTVFLKQLIFKLVSDGEFDVYEPQNGQDSTFNDFIGDFDLLIESGRKSIIIIDNYLKYDDLLEHYSNINPSRIQVVATTRFNNLSNNPKLNFFETSLDYLDQDELKGFIQIIDTLSLWGQDAGKTERQKITELERKYQSQISYILLKVFESTDIQNRINSVLTEIVVDNETKKTLFIIALLGFLDKDLKHSLIYFLSKSRVIYKSSFISNSHLGMFFKIDCHNIEKRSSLLCQSIIRASGIYDSRYIINILLQLAEFLDSHLKNLPKKDHYLEGLLKELLKSSTIEKILPEGNKKLSNLKEYYDELKKVLPWLTEHSHYWVQYAMAHLTHSSLSEAEKCLTTAYSLAEKSKDYKTYTIDTQQARLYLLLSMRELDSSKIFSYFQLAHTLLLKVPNDTYRYRQVLIYQDFYEKSYDRLSKHHKSDFINLCSEMKEELKKYNNKFENPRFNWVVGRCEDILFSLIGKNN